MKDKLLFLTKLIGIGLIVASVAVGLIDPDGVQAEHVIGLLGFGILLDGRVAELIRDWHDNG